MENLLTESAGMGVRVQDQTHHITYDSVEHPWITHPVVRTNTFFIEQYRMFRKLIFDFSALATSEVEENENDETCSPNS